MSEMISINYDAFIQSAYVLNHELSHVFYKDGDHYNLIIHGGKGFVEYNGMLCTFQKVLDFLRMDYNIPNETFLDVKVYCCYGATQVPYNDEYNNIESAYNNKYELFVNHLRDDNNCYCVYSYNN